MTLEEAALQLKQSLQWLTAEGHLLTALSAAGTALHFLKGDGAVHCKIYHTPDIFLCISGACHTMWQMKTVGWD